MKRPTAEPILEATIALAAAGFLWWAFGWKAAIAWTLIQAYSNLRTDNAARKAPPLFIVDQAGIRPIGPPAPPSKEA